MPPQTIHAKIYSRTLGLVGPGPIYTCTKLVAVDRRDGAGEFRAEFPSGDTMLERLTIKENYLQFELGGKFLFLGLVERMWTETDEKGKQTTIISGRDQLGALAENTVADLELVYSFNAPELIISAADVPNQNFSLSAEGYLVTGYPFTKQFAGESALSALTKLAADIGEHFRAPKDTLLEVVWMGQNAPTAPVRLVTAGGPLLHENSNVAIISHIERDNNGEQMFNRIYPYGAGVGAARLTLQHATTEMPTGYSMDTSANYIQNDDQQSLPSVRKSMQKVWNHIGVDIGQTYTIQVATTALTGATMIIVESIALPMASGVLLDLNGGGTDFVELSAPVSVGANVLNVVATTFDVLDTDNLVYTNPQAETGAANQLAYAALTYLQRISEPSRMVAYKLTVRGLPDTVTVGMTIPVLSQAPGFAIDDDLIILEITRQVTRNGQTPVVLKVVPVDWFDLGEASSIATTMEDFRVSQAQAQPVTYASIIDAPAPTDHGGLTGLSDDDHAQYVLLAGRAGGTTIYAGTAAGDALVLYSTSNATKGSISLANVLYVDEVNSRVGIGIASVNATALGIKPGSSSNDAAVGGVLYEDHTQTGNSGTTKTTLGSYSVPANTLNVDGQSLWFEVFGTFTAGAGAAMQVYVDYAGAAVLTYAFTLTGNAWSLRGRIVRTSSTATKSGTNFFFGAPISGTVQKGSPAATHSSANALVISGKAPASNQMYIETFIVGWDDANT